MKNTKKIISLVLAICMLASLAISASAANTVDASGGTGTSSVTLSSTADGSIGGDPAATKMSVTVPTVLPIAVGTDGTVSTATDAKIVNNSFGAVKVNSVSIEAAQNAGQLIRENFGSTLVVNEMKKLPTDDPLFGKGMIRVDGRKIHPAYLFEVKKPSESKGPWDLYKLQQTIPADKAFRPLNEGNCPLVKS